MTGSPSVQVRAAEPGDAPAIAELMRAYMQETYHDSWHGSAESVLRDGFGRAFEIQVVETPPPHPKIVGLAAWIGSYDFHHCITGGEILDLYVAREFRGRGVGAGLVFAVAAEIRRQDGSFLRGRAVESPAVRRLYARIAVCSSGVECTVGGRAFRCLAELAGSTARVAARSLPEKSWNYEP